MKILIIGLGAVGQRHARNLRTLLGAGVELSAYRQRGIGNALTEGLEVEPGITPEERFGIKAFHDLDQALAEAPAAIIVANPTSRHLATTRQGLAAGCAVFIEKPVSHSWDGVPELVAEVARRKVPTLVGCQWRFHPLLVRVKDLLEQHVLGRIIAARAVYGEYMPAWHPYEDYRRSYAARSELGGGVLLTQIHDMDYLGWLIGWPECVWSVGGHLSQLEMDVEDTASTLMQCVVDGRSIPVHLHQDYLQRPPARRFEIVLEKGKICCDLLSAHLRAFDATGRCILQDDRPDFERNDLFLAEMRHFLACVEGRETSRLPLTDGVRSLAVALAARQSLGLGRVIPVVYLSS